MALHANIQVRDSGTTLGADRGSCGSENAIQCFYPPTLVAATTLCDIESNSVEKWWGGETRRTRCLVGAQSSSMKMHSPGHSSAASLTASFRSLGTRAMPAAPPGSLRTRSLYIHVGQVVIEHRKDSQRDLCANAITGAQILVDPHLHRLACPRCRAPMSPGSSWSGPLPPIATARTYEP